MFSASLVLPVNAQDADGFIRDDSSYGYRENTSASYIIGTQHFGSDEYGGFEISTQQFGTEAPLGGELLIMIGAGAVYAAIKRKRN